MSPSARRREALSSVLTCIACFCAIALAVVIAAPNSKAVAASWTSRRLPPAFVEQTEEGPKYTWASLNGVSCPTKSLCVAVGGEHTLAFSQEPSAAGAEWHVVNPTAGPTKACGVEEEPPCYERGGRLQAVSCASQYLCVALTDEGFIYVSTEPTGPSGAWTPTAVNEPGGHGATHLSALSCPSPSLCVAVSGGYKAPGKVLTSTDPTSGQWQASTLGTPLDLRGVSCGTPSLCVAVAREGRLFVSTNPTGGASAWREVGAPGGSGDLEGVSCASTALCAAGNQTGNVLTSINPAAGAASWSEAKVGASVQITAISCPTAGGCVAVDDNGDVLTSSDPTGGAGSWSVENLVPYGTPGEFEAPGNALFGASCVSLSLCAVVGSEGRIFTSTDEISVPGSPARHSHRRFPKRPPTVLLFAEHFWEGTVSRRHRVRARFRFFARTKTLGFECKRDRGPYRRCRSPLRYWVGHGHHVLRVRAIGPTGLRGPVSIKRFRLSRPRAIARGP